MSQFQVVTVQDGTEVGVCCRKALILWDTRGNAFILQEV